MGQTEKQKEWKQNEFQSNKEIHNLRQRERRQNIRDLVEKLKKPCLICGETEKACIDFHHVDKDDKEFTIASVCNHKWSDDKIINEIEKCVCLCANHHRVLHRYDLTVDELFEKYKK